FRTDPRTGKRYPIGITVESKGRGGRFGWLHREGAVRPWYVRLRDDDGRVFNLKVVARSREDAIQRVLTSMNAREENIVRVSPYREGLTRTALKTIGRTAES